MHIDDFFRSVGGVPEPLVGGEPNGPAWNFGLLQRAKKFSNTRESVGTTGGSSQAKSQVARSTDTLSASAVLSDVAPHVVGRWDGRSSINLLSAAKRGLGFEIPAQHQRRGTCGGRAGSLAGNILQGLQKAAGEPIEYRPISHAWLYAAARQQLGILGPEDGVLSGSIPPIMRELGNIHQQESQGDDNYVSPTTDRRAVEWGMYGPPREFAGLAVDNPVKSVARCRSAAELADALASGCVICISDSQGFSMTRDRDGFCQPQGTWYHYHVFAGLVVLPSGRRGFAYVQSWGPNSPDGPSLPDFATDRSRLADYPSHVFGVDWDTADLMARTGDAHAMSQFAAWQIPEIPWLFG